MVQMQVTQRKSKRAGADKFEKVTTGDLGIEHGISLPAKKPCARGLLLFPYIYAKRPEGLFRKLCCPFKPSGRLNYGWNLLYTLISTLVPTYPYARGFSGGTLGIVQRKS